MVLVSFPVSSAAQLDNWVLPSQPRAACLPECSLCSFWPRGLRRPTFPPVESPRVRPSGPSGHAGPPWRNEHPPRAPVGSCGAQASLAPSPGTASACRGGGGQTPSAALPDVRIGRGRWRLSLAKLPDRTVLLPGHHSSQGQGRPRGLIPGELESVE